MEHRRGRSWCLCVVVWALSAIGAEARQAPAPSAEPAPLCRVAADPEYGLVRDKPVQVGGAGFTGAARQRRYLDALRGPKGEHLRYERQGSTMIADETMVDLYSVSYDGLPAPVTIYIDFYHATELFAPRGFVCGSAFDLHTPPPNPMLAMEQLTAHAAQVAAAPGFRAAPVTLGDEPAYGIVIDRFRTASRRVRPGAKPLAGPAAVPGTIVIAYPQQCGTRTVPATGIALLGSNGLAVEPTTVATALAEVRARAPGQTVPDGSVAATFDADALLDGSQVRLSYADPACAGEAAERRPPITYAAARLLESPMPARPADDTSNAPWVAVQAVIDHQGRFQQLHPLGGSPALVAAARAALATWTARPATANGAPLVTAVVLQVTFLPTR